MASAAPTTTVAPRPAAGPTAGTSVPTATTGPVHPPADVKVLVANGSGISGLAGRVSTRLHTAGYDTLAGVNATQRVATSVVYYTAGYQREAGVLAQSLSLPPTSVQPVPTPPPVASLGSANILVVAGPDLSQGSTGATTTVPTTAASSTTTPQPSTTVHTATTPPVTSTVTTVKR